MQLQDIFRVKFQANWINMDKLKILFRKFLIFKWWLRNQNQLSNQMNAYFELISINVKQIPQTN